MSGETYISYSYIFPFVSRVFQVFWIYGFVEFVFVKYEVHFAQEDFYNLLFPILHSHLMSPEDRVNHFEHFIDWTLIYIYIFVAVTFIPINCPYSRSVHANYIVLSFHGLERTFFLISGLGNDIQLALAAIFNGIIFKRCVKLCEF